MTYSTTDSAFSITHPTDLVKYWLDLSLMSEQEKSYVCASCPSSQYLPVLEEEHTALAESYFLMMPFSHTSVSTHCIELFDCATDGIKALFERFCKYDDVLVVTSNNEHNNVKELVSQQKHVYIINEFNEKEFESVVKKYKKVFFYHIGTQISNGIITPQYVFEKVKEIFIRNNIEHVMILDDVHGMFIVPRDYSVFDYVIYTCHALVTDFNLGMVIRKKESPTLGGFIDYNKSIAYKKALDIILSRKEKFYQFKYVMYQYFEDLFEEGVLKLPDFITAPHIFAPEVKITHTLYKDTYMDIKNKLKEYGMRIEASFNENDECNSKIYLRIREAQYFTNPELLIPGLELCRKVLEFLK